MEREPISKKLRFEVFKRDSFTCQYCGSKAPDADPESIINVAKTVRSWTGFKDSLDRFIDIQAADEVSADATGTET